LLRAEVQTTAEFRFDLKEVAFLFDYTLQQIDRLNPSVTDRRRPGSYRMSLMPRAKKNRAHRLTLSLRLVKRLSIAAPLSCNRAPTRTQLEGAQHLLYNLAMNTTPLPPVRLTAAVREQIADVLLDGETLSHFVEQASIDAARRRKAQQEFVARGRASLARSLETGESYPANEVLDAMTSPAR